MKILTKSVAKELKKIMDEEGLSADEIANLANISRVTIYRIINESVGFTQRAVIRRLAEGTGRTFKISGDSVIFTKVEKKEMNNYSDEERKLLDVFRELDNDEQDLLINFAGTLCKTLKSKRMKRNEDL